MYSRYNVKIKYRNFSTIVTMFVRKNCPLVVVFRDYAYCLSFWPYAYRMPYF